MYKIAIIYAGATYESALNHIRIQELLGKIKVIGIGMQDIYAEYVDGYPVTTIENILQQEWDYLLIAGQEQKGKHHIKSLLGWFYLSFAESRIFVPIY